MRNCFRMCLFLALSLTLTFTGCSPAFYAPNNLNVPMFKQKDEGRLSTGFSTSGGTAGIDIQGAYAIGKNVGVIANTQYLRGTSPQGTLKGRNMNLETGFGYFFWPENDLLLELYGGMGRSYAKQEEAYQFNGTTIANNFKGFIQPSIGYKHNNFEIAFSYKVAFVRYDHPFTVVTEELVNFNVIDWMLTGNAPTNRVEHQEGPDYKVYEPAVTYRYGNENVKLQMQLIYSANKIYRGQFFLYNAGLNFRFHPKPKLNLK